jgi:hypothetical protein
VQLADGTSYQCSEAIENCTLKIGPFQDRVHAYVFPLTRFDLILGTPWLSKHVHEPEISWRAGELKLSTPEGPLILKAHQDYPAQDGGLLSSMQFSRAIQIGEETFLCLLRHPKDHPDYTASDPETVAAYDAAVQQLLEEFKDVLPEKLPAGLPPRRVVDHEIELEPGHVPPSRPTYRMSYEELHELKRQLMELLESGYIQPSKSPFGVPILYGRKAEVCACVLTTAP